MVRYKLPDIAYLRECFTYDPESGVLVWKHRPRHHFPTSKTWANINSRQAGQVAGFTRSDGICMVGVGGKNLHRSRIIWMLMTGLDPGDFLVDHANRNPGDNRWENLRLATHADNMRNAASRTNQTGLKGVECVGSTRNPYSSRITVNHRRIYLGVFPTAAAAHAAYCAAAREHFGEFWSDGA